VPSACPEGNTVWRSARWLGVTNIVAIQVAGSIVMWLGGYRGMPQQLPGSELKRNIVSVAVLCSLAVLLSIHLEGMVRNELYKASVRRILNAAAATHNGAYLTEVRFRRDSGRAGGCDGSLSYPGALHGPRGWRP
jgi:hypothetical protein